MAWTNPTTRSTSTLITASIWNTDLVDNLNYLYSTVNSFPTPVKSVANGTKIVNTITESDLISYTIPANTLYTGSANFAYLMEGQILAYNNRGSADNGPAIKFYYGGTAHYTRAGGASELANGTYFLLNFSFMVAGDGATNVQNVSNSYTVKGEMNASTDYTGATGHGAGATDAEDSTATSIMKITVTLPTANAAQWARIHWARVTKIANV
jgi:hypothetical protein